MGCGCGKRISNRGSTSRSKKKDVKKAGKSIRKKRLTRLAARPKRKKLVKKAEVK